MCALPAYLWAQGYLARKSEKSDLAPPFNQQEVVKVDDANAPEPPKPDEIHLQVPPMDDVQPKVSQQPESTALVEDGLVAYYDFNGDTNDKSGNGRDILNVKHTWVSGVDGQKNGAIHFTDTPP
ncbi:MAG: hypothetical protein WKF77_30055 [Planctomycetaceae bacterium]